MKRILVIAWSVFAGLAALFLVIGWLVSPAIRHTYPFGDFMKAMSADTATLVPAIRYLRKGDDSA
jgi:hypothetical protein